MPSGVLGNVLRNRCKYCSSCRRGAYDALWLVGGRAAPAKTQYLEFSGRRLGRARAASEDGAHPPFTDVSIADIINASPSAQPKLSIFQVVGERADDLQKDRIGVHSKRRLPRRVIWGFLAAGLFP
jgi:hypothetical protein